MTTVIGLIPARGGSKGLPGKNIKPLNGKPMLAYTIEAGLNSQALNCLVVSSDDEDILAIAKQYGAETDNRPSLLAQDDTSIDAVVSHFVELRGLTDETVIVLLQPTSPLRTARHVHDAIQWFFENDGDGLISVKTIDRHLLYAYVQDEQFLTPISPLIEKYPRRQDLPPVYVPNGALYIFTVAAFRQQGTIPKSKLVPFVMLESESVDVDSEEDLRLCSRYLLELPERRKR